MNQPTRRLAALSLTVLFLGCSSDSSSTKTDEVEQAWAMSIGDVALTKNKASKLVGGTCRVGTVAGLEVELCAFKDAISADSAREKGLALIGAHTGVSLVRGKLLLVAFDANNVDVHGKTLNKLSGIFLTLEDSTTAAKGL